MASIYNIEFDNSESYELIVTYKDSSGDPINLTGYTAKGEIRGCIDGDLVGSFTITFDVDRATGVFVISMTATQTALIEEGTYLYDVFLVGPSSSDKILKGDCIIGGSITEDP